MVVVMMMVDAMMVLDAMMLMGAMMVANPMEAVVLRGVTYWWELQSCRSVYRGGDAWSGMILSCKHDIDSISCKHDIAHLVRALCETNADTRWRHDCIC